jgi:prepilin-type N-terminal cleavage/methylation domain-containing protein
MKNERGLTLIEVLAAVTVLSIIGVIVWNAFFQGYEYSQTAVSKNTMNQEANLIITNLTRIHQTSESYTLSNIDNTIVLTVTKPEPSKTIKFEHSQMEFVIDLKGHSMTIDPTKTEDKKIDLTITIKDKNDSSNQVEVDTILYRL